MVACYQALDYADAELIVCHGGGGGISDVMVLFLTQGEFGKQAFDFLLRSVVEVKKAQTNPASLFSPQPPPPTPQEQGLPLLEQQQEDGEAEEEEEEEEEEGAMEDVVEVEVSAEAEAAAPGPGEAAV